MQEVGISQRHAEMGLVNGYTEVKRARVVMLLLPLKTPKSYIISVGTWFVRWLAATGCGGPCVHMMARLSVCLNVCLLLQVALEETGNAGVEGEVAWQGRAGSGQHGRGCQGVAGLTTAARDDISTSSPHDTENVHPGRTQRLVPILVLYRNKCCSGQPETSLTPFPLFPSCFSLLVTIGSTYLTLLRFPL